MTRLNSVPKLGVEHAAYRVETTTRTYWIDCPSSFDEQLAPVDAITFTHKDFLGTFTHKDFLGASNLYRNRFEAEVWLHEADSTNPFCRGFVFDRLFESDFIDGALEAHHLGRHSPGYCVYMVENVLFACDLVFLKGERARYNPYGPADETAQAGRKLRDILEGRDVATVCGWNYVTDYQDWKPRFDRLVADG